MRSSRALATVLLVLALQILTATGSASAPEVQGRAYQHPKLDVQFSAPDGWGPIRHPEDDLIYEVTDSKTGIHVILWYTATVQDAAGYLCKMADMKDLASGGCEPQTRDIGGLEAWFISVSAEIGGEAVHALLAVIPCGTDRVHIDHNALYVAQIWCPAGEHPHVGERMEKILDTVRIRTRIRFRGRELPLFPQVLVEPPEAPSPFTADDGQECAIARTRDGTWTVVPVTVEDGVPAAYDRDLWGKGRQLAVDAIDFPTLARTGLHEERELDRETITGIPIRELTAAARPGRLSRHGFLGPGENLLDVILRDNRLVAGLGLTHHQLARPLFHLFNLVQRGTEVYRRGEAPHAYLTGMSYAGRTLTVAGEGGKGWQEPLFGDEVLGYYTLDVSREPDPTELAYLEKEYRDLDDAEFARLVDSLFSIHTGEMVPFYIRRYGFYEGKTTWRADPVAVALVFGLMDIEEIDAATKGGLAGILER